MLAMMFSMLTSFASAGFSTLGILPTSFAKFVALKIEFMDETVLAAFEVVGLVVVVVLPVVEVVVEGVVVVLPMVVEEEVVEEVVEDDAVVEVDVASVEGALGLAG